MMEAIESRIKEKNVILITSLRNQSNLREKYKVSLGNLDWSEWLSWHFLETDWATKWFHEFGIFQGKESITLEFSVLET